MASSGANKLFIGQRGFPTPNAAPDETVCRVFLIPAQEDYQALLMGALDALTKEYNWYIDGALSQAEAATFFADMIDQAYAQSLTGQCSLDVPAPYWDAVTDLDVEAPALEQSWYGSVHFSDPTFVEQIAIWAIAAFIAYSGQIGAAVAFLTVAPKFVLAFKTRDVGGIIRIFIDAAEYGRVDTYSPTPGIANFTVVADPGMDTHQIYCVLSDETNPDIAGDPTIAVIRKELSADEAAPPNTRYDPTGDQFQRSPDDGATWVDSPSDDPRHSDIFRFPPLSGTGHECDAAARIVAQWKETVDGFVAAIDQYTFATNFIALAVEFLPGAGLLIDLALIFFNILAAIGVSAIEAAFTDAQWHTIQCIISCHIGADGQLSADQLTAVFADIDATQTDVVKGTLHAIRGLYGEVLSSNVGVERTETGDCSDCLCGWCWELNFETGDQGMTAYLGVYGTYDAGNGWQSVPVPPTSYSAIVYKLLAFTMHITSINVTVSYSSDPAGDGTAVIQVGTTDGSSFTPSWTWTPIAGGAINTYTHDYSSPEDWSSLYINPNGGVSNTATIHSIEFLGVIDPPPDAGNCE